MLDLVLYCHLDKLRSTICVSQEEYVGGANLTCPGCNGKLLFSLGDVPEKALIGHTLKKE